MSRLHSDAKTCDQLILVKHQQDRPHLTRNPSHSRENENYGSDLFDHTNGYQGWRAGAGWGWGWLAGPGLAWPGLAWPGLVGWLAGWLAGGLGLAGAGRLPAAP